MIIIKNIILSEEAPLLKDCGWLVPLKDGTFKLKFFTSNGWQDSSSGTIGPKGDKGEQGTPGTNGKSIKSIELISNGTNITGGTATMDDDSVIPITVTTQSE